MTLYLVFKLGPRYGHVHPAIYLTITAVGSAYLISSSQGFGVAIIYSVEHWQNDNQLLMWEFYVLGAFIIATIIFQIDFLNRSLRYFSASIVTPLNFVFMSTVTLITTSVLYQGFQVNSVITAITIIIGFLVIVLGVTLILQYNLKLSKVTAMEEQKIQDEFGNPIDWNLSDDNPFSLLNKTYSLHSVRIEPLGDDHHNVADIERSGARRNSYTSLESKTPADPHFANDGSQADDGGSN